LAAGPTRDGGSAPAATAFGLSDPADINWVERHLVPHPENCFDAPLALPQNQAAQLPRSYIYCDDPAMGPFDQFAAKFENDSAWRTHVLHTGHDAMVSDPEGVIRVLREDAAR
jgi:hypothetical protein